MNPLSVLTVEKLIEHQGHKLDTAVWGQNDNIALVCNTCQEILADWDEADSHEDGIDNDPCLPTCGCP